MQKRQLTSTQRTALWAVFVLSLMILFYLLYNPWMAIGPNLIQDGGFETAVYRTEWTGWGENTQHSEDSGFNGSPGVILSASTNHTGVLRLTVFNPGAIEAFRVSLRARTENTQPGDESWHVPRAIFFYRDLDGDSLFSIRHGIFNLYKDSNWSTYTGIFPVPQQVLDGRLQIQNLGADGKLFIDDVSVVPIAPRPSAPILNSFFFILWSAVFSLAVIVLRPWITRAGCGVLALSILIIIGVLLPKNTLDESISKSVEILTHKEPSTAQATPAQSAPRTRARLPAQSYPAPIREKEPTLIDWAHVAGHTLSFMALAIFSTLRWAPKRVPRALLCLTAGLILFAGATEVLQFTTIDREPAFDDLFTDSIGILVAVVGTTLFLRRVPRFGKSAS